MVRIDRVSTRTGDDGSTGLGDGRRVAKDHPLIEALGAVDEANSLLGVVLVHGPPEAVALALRQIQNDLFDLGADLCLPANEPRAKAPLRIGDGHLARLDRELAAANAGLQPLTSFVLPGGTPAAAWLHLARTVVRRAERALVAAGRAAPGSVGPDCVRYLNRLSDCCFVWARLANDGGRADVAWRPGAGA